MEVLTKAGNNLVGAILLHDQAPSACQRLLDNLFPWTVKGGGLAPLPFSQTRE
jgi:hypothetical protein